MVEVDPSRTQHSFATHSRPRRILIIYRRYWPHIGGVEKMIAIVADGLVKNGWSVRMLVCHDRRARAEVRRISGIPVVYAASLGTVLSLPLSPSFFRLFRRLSKGADVVHWHEPFPLATLAALTISHRSGVATYHSDIVRQRGFRRIANWLMRRALNRANAVVTTSRALKNNSKVLRELQRAIDVIPIGMELPADCDPRGNAQQDWLHKYGDRGPYVLFVGRLVYYKGLHILLEAAARSMWPLVIIGHGPLEASVRALIAARSLQKRVTLITEHISDVELSQWFRRCKFFVLPSVERAEAFGIVQVEAMAVGKPVVNTNLPTGVPFVSLNGETGITVPPRDVDALMAACDRLWFDNALCEKLGAQAAIRARAEFSREVMVRRYIELFERVCKD